MDDVGRRVLGAIASLDLDPGPAQRCAYLPDHRARNVAFVAPVLPSGVYHTLMDQGFRRSGVVIYRPTCDGCSECQQSRVPVAAFSPSRSQRRNQRGNRDLVVEVGQPTPTDEKHELFVRYLADRHDGTMDGSYATFVEFLYESPVTTREVVYRLGSRLVSVGILDVEPSAASTVYCYFEPSLSARGLGVFNILFSIDYCRRAGLDYLYLGYYVAGCPRMSYKVNYRPYELLGPDGRWATVSCPS